MKKLLSPGFEFMFALGIIAIFMLPPIVMAQSHKEDLEVNINNKDTLINGKNIRDLSPAERKEALAKLNGLNDNFSFKFNGPDSSKRITLRMRKNGDKTQDIVIERDGKADDVIATIPDMGNRFFFRNDSASRAERRSELRKLGDMSGMSFNFEPMAPGNNDPQVYSFNNGRTTIMGRNRKNTQSFSFSNVDNDGISTHIDFNVSDASADNAKRIAGTEKTDLEIKDLVLSPQFSSNKLTINFSLTGTGTAEVSFKNTEGAILWTGKAVSNNFTKTFELPQNGVYYLEVKQGGKTGLKRIIKEE